MTYRISAGDTQSLSMNEPDRVKSILQNIRIILSTPKCSVPLDRNFGLNMSFIDKPELIARPLIIAQATEAIQEYEPRASVVNLTFNEAGTNGKLVPVVEVEILDEQ